jgi:hypothetical protein
MLMHHDDQRSSATPVPAAEVSVEAARAQIERLLTSDTLRSAEALRRLLRFLAEKTFSGEADGLKEYSVGLDALGKPPTYDPRTDSGVRLQASRLRQKLDEYYRGEGKNDAVIVELPKSKFKVAWHAATPSVPAAAEPVAVPETSVSVTSTPPFSGSLKTWRRFALGTASALLVLISIDAWWILRSSPAIAMNSTPLKLSPDVDALWNPFLGSKRHMIIVHSDPVFAEFEREGSPNILFRTRDVTGWDEEAASPEFSQLRRSLGNPPAKPNYEYVSRGELAATFALSQFFAGRRGDMSVTRLGELSWQQFADNDVILLAARTRVEQLEAALPVTPAFMARDEGIVNLKPLPGEPAVFGDGGHHPDSNGESFELVSVLPGPLGRTTVASFTGGFGWGVIGAIQSLTDAGFAHDAAQRLKSSSGSMPRYYQLVMKIRYREGTPTEAYCVAQRAMNLTLAQDKPSR